MQFRHTAEYYGWCEADCLFVLSLALTGATLKFFNILFNREEVMTFSFVVARLEERFGKDTLRAAHHLEFNCMTQGSEESVEQWGDQVMEAVICSRGKGLWVCTAGVGHNALCNRL